MDAYLAMNLTRHQSVKAFQGYLEGVRYQIAKSRFWEMKREGDRLTPIDHIQSALESNSIV